MTDEEFRCFLDLLMSSDPWPVHDGKSQNVLEKFAKDQSRIRGFPNWIEAFHRFQPE